MFRKHYKFCTCSTLNYMHLARHTTTTSNLIDPVKVITLLERIQMTMGTEDATLPTSSSSCMIFLILAYSKTRKMDWSNDLLVTLTAGKVDSNFLFFGGISDLKLNSTSSWIELSDQLRDHASNAWMPDPFGAVMPARRCSRDS